MRPCYEYLRTHFGDRIDLIEGDSRDVLPQLFNLRPNLAGAVEGWIIDGGHGLDVALADIENVVNLAKPGDSMVFDDTDWGPFAWLLKFYELQGVITPATTLPASHGHLFYSINK